MGVLNHNFDSVIDEGAGSSPPWIEDYLLPDELKVRNQISEIEAQLEELKSELKEPARYKGLLFETGAPLEEIVLKSLEDLGLEVGEEVPGKRDGLIKLDNKSIVLEIHGTTSNISKSKCRQLAEWKLNHLQENVDNDVEGMLIANPQRDERPENRPHDLLSSEQKIFMEKQNLKALSTIELFKAIYAYRNTEFDKNEFLTSVEEADVIVSFEGVKNSPV